MSTIKTNELKKGDLIKLRNGWYAEVADNLKGNTRMCKVYGHCTETGSVYAHDIECKLEKLVGEPIPGRQYLTKFGSMCEGKYQPGLYLMTNVELTPAQTKLRAQLQRGGW